MRSPRISVDRQPFLVIWETTRACPLACRHCRAEAQPERNPAELTTAEAVGLFGQVRAFGTPAPLLVLTGGDPLERPDLLGLVESATRLGLMVALAPSATPALTRDRLAQARGAGVRAVSLSLDGSTPARHDAFRGVDGVYEGTVRAAEDVRDLGLRLQINTTVAGSTVADLPDILRVVHRLGAALWSVFFLVPTGRGRAVDGLSPAQVDDVLNFLYEAGTVVPIKTTEAPQFRRVIVSRDILARHGVADPAAALGLGPLHADLRRRLIAAGLPSRRRGQRRSPLDVNAGRGFVFVAFDGSVHPSGFLPVPAGNVRTRSLVEIYRDSALFRALRDPNRLAGRCGRCEFRSMCGGSRSRAYADCGDPLGAEPWCDYQPGSFPYPDEVTAAVAAPSGRAAPSPGAGSS